MPTRRVAVSGEPGCMFAHARSCDTIGTGLAGTLSQISRDFTSLPARLRFDLARFRRDPNAEE